MNLLDLQTSFYVTGGTLRRDAACYVRREADEELYQELLQGKFCYVLTSRQMGKSSLMVHTAGRLREDGIGVAVLDLTAIGSNLTIEQWYGGLLSQIGQQLDLEDELLDFWAERSLLGPLQLWMRAIREVVLPRYLERVVIFVDEIDAVHNLLFSTDSRRLATANGDNIVKIYDLATRRLALSLKHDTPVLTMAYSPDRKYLATGCQDSS